MHLAWKINSSACAPQINSWLKGSLGSIESPGLKSPSKAAGFLSGMVIVPRLTCSKRSRP